MFSEILIKGRYTNSEILNTLKSEINLPEPFLTLLFESISMKSQKKFKEAFFLFFTLLEGAVSNLWLHSLGIPNNLRQLELEKMKLCKIIREVDSYYSFRLFENLLLTTEFTKKRNAIVHAKYLFLNINIKANSDDINKLFSEGYSILKTIQGDLF